MDTTVQEVQQFKVVKKFAPSAQDDVRRMRFRCASLTQLFMDPMPPDVVHETLGKGKRPPPDKTSPIPPRCQKKLCKDQDDNLCIPQDWLFACLEAGSPNVKIGKKKMGTAKTSELGSMLTILESTIKITRNGVPLTDKEGDWKPDVRRGIGKTGIANAIYRPSIDNYEFEFTVKVNIGQLEGCTEQNIVDLVDTAGRQKGIGAFRKRFGRFRVVEAELLEPVKGNGSGS
ncbi:MAG: hypothetical protein WC641_02575 [Patescibacteria group bacterium]